LTDSVLDRLDAVEQRLAAVERTLLGLNAEVKPVPARPARGLALYALSLCILELAEAVGPRDVRANFQIGHTAVSAVWGVLGLALLYVGLRSGTAAPRSAASRSSASASPSCSSTTSHGSARSRGRSRSSPSGQCCSSAGSSTSASARGPKTDLPPPRNQIDASAVDLPSSKGGPVEHSLDHPDHHRRSGTARLFLARRLVTTG